jgi:hypothetical protein
MIKTFNRKAKYIDLKPYCHFAKENDYIEITEWSNIEGFDITINGEKHLSLTWGQWDALQVIVNYKES